MNNREYLDGEENAQLIDIMQTELMRIFGEMTDYICTLDFDLKIII
jgi:hypothetical protein